MNPRDGSEMKIRWMVAVVVVAILAGSLLGCGGKTAEKAA